MLLHSLQSFIFYYDFKNERHDDSKRKRGKIMITYRRATPEDVRPALDLALKVFIEFETPGYEPIAIVNFKKDCIDNQFYTDSLISGDNAMFVALADGKIVGMVAERNGHIWLLFVDGAFHRQGIATALMRDIVCALKLKGYNEISSTLRLTGYHFTSILAFSRRVR